MQVTWWTILGSQEIVVGLILQSTMMTNDYVDTFMDDKLVVVSVDAAELTNIVGDDGTPFFADNK
jgi:hypothetical protein